MIKIDEDALICDLAETYHIYNYKELPLNTVALFATGLREDSRIRMKMSGAQARPEILLFAAMVDRLSILAWQNTKDAEKGRNAPKSILEVLTVKDNNSATFSTGEDFEKERQRLIQGG